MSSGGLCKDIQNAVHCSIFITQYGLEVFVVILRTRSAHHDLVDALDEAALLTKNRDAIKGLSSLQHVHL